MEENPERAWSIPIWASAACWQTFHLRPERELAWAGSFSHSFSYWYISNIKQHGPTEILSLAKLMKNTAIYALGTGYYRNVVRWFQPQNQSKTILFFLTCLLSVCMLQINFQRINHRHINTNSHMFLSLRSNLLFTVQTDNKPTPNSNVRNIKALVVLKLPKWLLLRDYWLILHFKGKGFRGWKSDILSWVHDEPFHMCRSQWTLAPDLKPFTSSMCTIISPIYVHQNHTYTLHVCKHFLFRY